MRWNVPENFDSYDNSTVRISAAYSHIYFNDAISQADASDGVLLCLCVRGSTINADA
jgi:hypothetical protein